MDSALLVAAGLFAVLSGANDGGALLAASLKLTSLRPLTLVLALSAMVAVGPILFGARVATTLVDRLVSFAGTEGRWALLAAITAAIVTAATMTRRGLPTSLTLALVGGILGSGVGAGMAVDWRWAVVVIVLAAAAPLAGAVGAMGILRVWSAAALAADVGRQVRAGHRLGFALQAVAYGSNDGQKVLAVFAIAAPASQADGVAAPPAVLGAAAALFAAGVVLGVRRHGSRLQATGLAVTPVGAVTAELSSAAAVIGSAVVGAPVSMTQALAGGLLGGGRGARGGHVHWHQAGAVAAAWLVTVPAAAVLAALLAALLTHSSA